MDIHGDKRQRIFISYILAGVAVLLAMGSYLYRGIAADLAIEPFLPQSNARMIVKEMGQFHKVRNAYPTSFADLKSFSYNLRNANWGTIEATHITWKHYHYVLVNLPEDRVALWAFPDGDYRVKGYAYCVIAGPNWARVWARPALSDEGIKALPRVPTMEVLTQAHFREVTQDKLQ